MPPIKVKIGLLLEWQLLGIYIIGPSSCFNLHMWLIFLRNLDLTENRNRKSTIPMTSDNPDLGFPLDHKEAGDFASLVGSLLYLANCTRPDISFAVGTLARHLRNPFSVHLKAVKHLLRYCISTSDYGLCFGGNPNSSDPVEVFGFSDSDYGSAKMRVSDEVINRRSVSGFVFLSNGTHVAWQIKAIYCLYEFR